jgi:hypothetical protein
MGRKRDIGKRGDGWSVDEIVNMLAAAYVAGRPAEGARDPYAFTFDEPYQGLEGGVHHADSALPGIFGKN